MSVDGLVKFALFAKLAVLLLVLAHPRWVIAPSGTYRTRDGGKVPIIISSRLK